MPGHSLLLAQEADTLGEALTHKLGSSEHFGAFVVSAFIEADSPTDFILFQDLSNE